MLTAGTHLGSYEVVAPLGAGGMGEVYKATDTRLDRIVAIKVLPSHVAADPELKPRFEREAKMLAALSHPHICPVFDVGQQDGLDFLEREPPATSSLQPFTPPLLDHIVKRCLAKIQTSDGRVRAISVMYCPGSPTREAASSAHRCQPRSSDRVKVSHGS